MNVNSDQSCGHNARSATEYTYKALAADFYYNQERIRTIRKTFQRGHQVIASKRTPPKAASNPAVEDENCGIFTMPDSIIKTQPPGMEWIIERKSKSKYAFRLFPIDRVVPNPQLAAIKIPDATPEIVAANALSDEQALLAKVRYNRLLDIFLGVAAYSLQNHLRTTVASMGQVEIDEIYVAIDKRGRQYVLPVQAKGGSDRLSTVQARQDIACCREKFPQLICRAISAQFVEDNLIALFELAQSDGEIRIVEERHYKLVPADRISRDDLRSYDA